MGLHLCCNVAAQAEDTQRRAADLGERLQALQTANAELLQESRKVHAVYTTDLHREPIAWSMYVCGFCARTMLCRCIAERFGHASGQIVEICGGKAINRLW